MEFSSLALKQGFQRASLKKFWQGFSNHGR
jgi:hypothetical protein